MNEQQKEAVKELVRKLQLELGVSFPFGSITLHIADRKLAKVVSERHDRF